MRSGLRADARSAPTLELRLGFELTPSRALLAEDPRRYVLEGTDRVLLGGRFSGPADLDVRARPSTSSGQGYDR